MNKRQNNTERIGVYAIGLIVEEWGWIFRTQDVADVGIDAWAEITEDGNPSGLFLAFQIKSGLGNVNESVNRFTYYASQVHYHYWLNLDRPMIFVLYDPLEKKAYYQKIEKKNFAKTERAWALKIPRSNQLSIEAKEDVLQLVYRSRTKFFEIETSESVDLYEILENLDSIAEASHSLKEQTEMITKWGQKTDEINKRMKMLLEAGHSISSPAVKPIFKKVGNDFNALAKRLSGEIEIFAYHISQGVSSYRKLFSYLVQYDSLIAGEVDAEEHVVRIESVVQAIPNAINGVSVFYDSIERYKDEWPNMKRSKQNILAVLSHVIQELQDAQALYEDFLQAAKHELTTKHNAGIP